MPKCVQPNAPWVKCCVCKKRIKTCERKSSIHNSYLCPAHPDGVQLSDKKWVCSEACWEITADAAA